MEKLIGFFERYPSFAFLLNIQKEGGEKKKLSQEDEKRVANSVTSLTGDLLYLYNLLNINIFHKVQSWLDEDPAREVVFLEEDLFSVGALVEEELIDTIFSHQRVHLELFFNQEGEDSLEQFAREVAARFPSPSVGFIASTSSDKKRSQILHDHLSTQTILQQSAHQESLYYHQLVANILPNVLQMKESIPLEGMRGAFRDIPVIICGAGPSLNHSFPFLKKMKEKALLFAGGSAITALGQQGISPHLGFAIDPNEEEYHRLRRVTDPKIPLCYGHRLFHSVLPLFSGGKIYMKTTTGGSLEKWLEEKLGVVGEPLLTEEEHKALSVTILAIKSALLLGCNPIIFTGLDLAYGEGELRYCDGVLPPDALLIEKKRGVDKVEERLITGEGKGGKEVLTAVKWKIEGELIGQIATRHPNVTWVDATFSGLKIPPVGHLPLDQYEKRGDLTLSYPLDEWFDREVVRGRGFFTQEKISGALDELKGSLLRVRTLLEELTQESQNQIIAQMDLEEELAYHLFFTELVEPFKMEERKKREGTPKREKELESVDKALFCHLLKLTCHYIELFRTYRI